MRPLGAAYVVNSSMKKLRAKNIEEISLAAALRFASPDLRLSIFQLMRASIGVFDFSYNSANSASRLLNDSHRPLITADPTTPLRQCPMLCRPRHEAS